VVQAPVPVNDDDDAEMLAARILEKEHELYPMAIQIMLTRQWRLEGRRVVCE